VDVYSCAAAYAAKLGREAFVARIALVESI